MTLPNFLMVGAAKSGTTSLYHYLKQHPDIFMSRIKEPHYFTDWREHVRNLEEYEALFSGWTGQKAVGEASTGYLYDASSPGRIKELIPEARIIIILRNPAEMAFALWRHMRRIGKRGERLSFRAALEVEPERLLDPAFPLENKKSWHANFFYFNRALYCDQVKRFIETFGRDRVLVLIFEEFTSNPIGACRQICSFLGIDPDFTPRIEKHNEGLEVRHRGLAKFLSKRSGFLDGLDGLIPGGVVAGTLGWLKKLNDKLPACMDESIRAELMEKYIPDIEKLEKLIEKDLSCWYAE